MECRPIRLKYLLCHGRYMFARDVYNNIEAVERVKERIGLRWTQTVDDIDVVVRSDGLGWEAYSHSPAIFCKGRTANDALGFYRFCLSEYRS